MNALKQLHACGQAVWLDSLRRGLVTGGGLDRLLREDAITGVTSNPTIFGKAIAGSADYDEAIRAMRSPGSALDVFYELALTDIRLAADVFRGEYDASDGRHGFVSFELEPRLARVTRGSIDSARELFARIDRPNAMIKVPGTDEGVPAVEELTFAGVNVNITLLFSVELYERVAEAYIRGLERRAGAGLPVDRVASVASFFVSRVDTAVDKLLPEDSPLRGTIAVANAKRAYRSFQSLFSGPRWERLAALGARVQRPLWASTGTKNPAYSDVLYVETLVGPDTVNTMPEATIDAFRDHGRVDATAITTGLDEAERQLSSLSSMGIDLDRITRIELVDAGIDAFEKDLQKLLGVIEQKLGDVRAGGASRPGGGDDLAERVRARLGAMARDDVVARIWRADHTVWKPDPTEIADRLGWLRVFEAMRPRVSELETFARSAAAAGFTHAVLLGMGGSSLAPEVFRATLGAGLLDLVVLDTTHPATVARVEGSLDLSRTLFVVASKSGTTVETMSHFAYFYERTGSDGSRFAAITDTGTPLEAMAAGRDFRAVFGNPPDIGGRYSALSLFGLVPAALLGADLHGLLDSAEEMAAACGRGDDNPGAWLGAFIGEACLAGRDKLTLVLDEDLASFGAWVEQLIAESTGKEGTGILPVDGEPLAEPEAYGDDRVFVSAGSAPSPLTALEAAGRPVARVASSAKQLGAELFRWEFATAVAGHVLGINPFDQPNVAEAKEATKAILDAGRSLSDEGFDDVDSVLRTVKPGDYVALLAYLDPTPEARAALERVRVRIRDRYRVATTIGFGPRYLHSTGQLHKGGPPSGVFVQVVEASRSVDRAIPGAPYTFGALIDAQAAGDLRSLRARGRRVARVTLEGLAKAP